LSFEKGGSHWQNESTKREYKTIGDFDRFSVISTTDEYKDIPTYDFFRCYQEKMEVFSDYSYNSVPDLLMENSCHNLFGYRAVNDSHFFDEENEKYPYTFVSLLQVGDLSVDDNNHNPIESILRSIERTLERFQKDHNPLMLYCIYHSLDLSDFFIFIKSYEYQETQKFICNINQGERIAKKIYTYTRTGFSNPNKMIIGKDRGIQNTTICKLIICAVIDNPNLFYQWKNLIKEKYPTLEFYNRLGHEDFCINLRNVDMKNMIIELYDGFLSEKSIDDGGYQGAIMRPRIIIDMKGDETLIYNSSTDINEPSSCANSERGEHSNIEVECSKVVDGNKMLAELTQTDILRFVQPCMKKALIELITAVAFLEQKQFARDIVSGVKLSFNKLIDEINYVNYAIANQSEYLLHCYDNSQVLLSPMKARRTALEHIASTNKIELDKQLKKYIDSIMSVIQGALHADKMFFQVPGFNATLYDVPSKLIVFYSSFIKNIISEIRELDEMTEKITSESKVEPCFVINVGLHEQMRIITLFEMSHSQYEEMNGSQLFVIEIPVNYLFMPKRLMAELTHEIAHKVGKTIRCREVRRSCITLCLCELMTEKLLSYASAKEYSEEIKKNIDILFPGDESRRILKQGILEYFVKKCNMLYISQGEHRDKTNRVLSSQKNGTDYLMDNITKLLSNMIENFIEPQGLSNFYVYTAKLVSHCLTLRESPESLNNLLKSSPEEVDEAIKVFMLTVQNNSDMMAFEMYLNNVCGLMSESFADLLMINLTRLKEEDYIEMFFQTSNQYLEVNYAEALSAGYTLERWCAVFQVAYISEEQETRNIFSFFEEKLSEAAESLNTGGEDETQLYWESARSVFMQAKENRGVSFNIVTKYVIQYLKECNTLFRQLKLRTSSKVDSQIQKKASPDIGNVYMNITNADTLEKFSENFYSEYIKFVE
jgi:hypothetical protein